MSKIVAFREKIMQFLRDNVPDLAEVDWYEGLFSHDDVKEWSLKTPCAWVSVTNIPTAPHSTGELSATLRVVVAVIDHDKIAGRDADARVWSILEQIAILANFNTFGEPDAGAASDVKFLRISDPDLRADRVSIGVVEWKSVLSIGVNRSRKRDEIYYQDRQVTQMPTTLAGRGRLRSGDPETVALDGEGYQGDSVLDQGVAEMPIVPAQRWEPNP